MNSSRFCMLLFVALSLTEGFGQETEKHGSNQPHKSSKHYDEDGMHDDDYDHEAVLGSRDAMEEFSQLPPEEAKSRLGKLVDAMDVNKDGAVDMEELSNWIKSSFLRMNEEETRDRMEDDDKNEDGQITWAEFVQAIYSMTEEELDQYRQSDLDSEEAKKKFDIAMKHTKAKFSAADLNGDSQLDAGEYAAFNYPHDYPHMTGVEADRVLDDYDENGDGKVQEDEYLGNAIFSKKSEEDKIAESANFRHQDKDGDGSLDKAEILAWISPNLEEIVKEEVAHLFQETDKDKDGRLSKAEILDEHELWVGSEATEYGEMLVDRDEL